MRPNSAGTRTELDFHNSASALPKIIDATSHAVMTAVEARIFAGSAFGGALASKLRNG